MSDQYIQFDFKNSQVILAYCLVEYFRDDDYHVGFVIENSNDGNEFTEIKRYDDTVFVSYFHLKKPPVQKDSIPSPMCFYCLRQINKTSDRQHHLKFHKVTLEGELMVNAQP